MSYFKRRLLAALSPEFLLLEEPSAVFADSLINNVASLLPNQGSTCTLTVEPLSSVPLNPYRRHTFLSVAVWGAARFGGSHPCLKALPFSIVRILGIIRSSFVPS
jgi:hypothetical protein